MTELDLKDGKIFLNKITEKIRTRLTEVDASIEAGQKDIQSMNEYYWENYTEMDEYGYENYDNQQALLHQVNDNQEKQKMRHRLRKMLEAPFFGRVDFIYDGEEEPEIFYIGIGNFAERTGMLPLIYDWRAPVSGLFYDYDKGPGSYKAKISYVRSRKNRMPSFVIHRIGSLQFRGQPEAARLPLHYTGSHTCCITTENI